MTDPRTEPWSTEVFEDALARALHGEVMTDLHPSTPMLAALLAVAAASDPAVRRRAVRAARAQQLTERPDDPDDGPLDDAPLDDEERAEDA